MTQLKCLILIYITVCFIFHVDLLVDFILLLEIVLYTSGFYPALLGVWQDFKKIVFNIVITLDLQKIIFIYNSEGKDK